MEGFYYNWPTFKIHSVNKHLWKRQRNLIFIEGQECAMYFKYFISFSLLSNIILH